ncbi:hypothetical protein AAMO2058_000716800 [Amorphochlora amoebiformis]
MASRGTRRWALGLRRGFSGQAKKVKSPLRMRIEFMRDCTLLISFLYVISPFESSRKFRESVKFKVQSYIRLGYVMRICGFIYLDYKISLGGFSNPKNKPQTTVDRVHERCAERLKTMLMRNGGLYIKIGQIMAELGHLFPRAYPMAMVSMYDQATLSSWKSVSDGIYHEFGIEPEYIWDEIKTEPLASASLAQVHVAHLNKKKMAVKIHHREVSKHAFMDIYALRLIWGYLKAALPEVAESYEWAVSELESALLRELNFKQEFSNCLEAEKNLEKNPIDNIRFPKIYELLSCLSVLTMRYEEGVPLSDRKAMLAGGVEPGHVAGIVSDLFCQMLMTDGFVHCDPHPGNLLVTWKREREGGGSERSVSSERGWNNSSAGIVVLDHALYRRLHPEFREGLRDLWKAALVGDVSDMRASARILIGDSPIQAGDIVLPPKVSDKAVDQLIELITHVSVEDLYGCQEPKKRLEILEGKRGGNEVFRGQLGGKEYVEGELLKEVNRFADQFRSVLQDKKRGGADLFYTLKALACLRASNRAIGVSENVALSGARRVVARTQAARHWFIKCLLGSGLEKVWKSLGVRTNWKEAVLRFGAGFWMYWLHARLWLRYHGVERYMYI